MPADQVIGDAFDNDATIKSVEPLWFESALMAAKDTVRAIWSDPSAVDRLLPLKPSPPAIEDKALYISNLEKARELDMGEHCPAD